MNKTVIKEFESFRDLVLKEYEKGNIVFMGIDGPESIPIDEFLKQPEDGILYDLNRNESVVLTFIEDQKWVNDYAVCKVIRKLIAKIDELEKQDDLSTNKELLRSFYSICKRKGKDTNWEGITKKIELILKPK